MCTTTRCRSPSPEPRILLERFLRHFAGYVDKPHGASTPVNGSFDVNLIEREPYGVVGVITPWNGALAVADRVLRRPSPRVTRSCSSRRKWHRWPPCGSANCVSRSACRGVGQRRTRGARGRRRSCAPPGIRKIHFTGGDATARKVLQSAAANLTPVVTELGGKSANIIFGDADLDAAAMLSAHQGPLMQSGQSCACASRVLVHESVHDAFVEKFVAVIQASTIGDPLDPQVVFGPVISQGAADRILAVIEQAVTQRSGELIVGGKRLGGELAQGYYIEPTVFIGVDNASALAQTETFGPVVSVIKFSDEAEAVRVANDTNYGLNAFVQTTNLSRAHRVARQLEAGSVWINTFSDISPQGPYGGCKQSGFGRTGGLEGLHEFLQVKNIRIGMR